MMNINKKTKKIPAGIAFRMLSFMIVFISLIFFAIFISFNFFIGEYVERDMINQLKNAVNDIIQNRTVLISTANPQIRNGSFVYDTKKLYISVVKYIKDRNEYSEVNTVIYSTNEYKRIFPDSEDYILQNTSEMDNIVNIVKKNNPTIENYIYKTPVHLGNYYFVTVDLSSVYLYNLPGLSAVFYVNANKYDNFIKNIYFMLLVILAMAMIFTFLYVFIISKSISKPIKKLCGFADEIGKGNFKRNEYSFKDRELLDLNERMNETAAKLAKNDEDQKIFFQNVSHELKTPLMSIRGYAEGIKYKVFEIEKDTENAADIIISESERLNGMVSDLLYISKMDASNNSFTQENMKKTDLAEIAGECAEKLRGLLIVSENNKKIEIKFPVQAVYIDCIKEELMRAVMNIVANCVQYAKTKVEISFFENEKNVFLYINDDGPGINEKDMPNIFKRFYKGKNGKHGIGLSIAKSIIERHDASISVKNKTDPSGAEFIVEFKKSRYQQLL